MTVGYRPRSVSATPPQLTVADAMRHNGMYPGRPEATVRETHSAWIFLAGERAYKVKKPVRMAFLDFSTLKRRRAVHPHRPARCRRRTRRRSDRRLARHPLRGLPHHCAV